MRSFFLDYAGWHYDRALPHYVRIYKNLWWFLVQFFSLPYLASSFFAPYKRVIEPKSRRFDLEDWLGRILINLLSRLIGMIIRFVIIISGIMTLVVYILLGCLGYVLWLVWPILIISCWVYGFKLLFS